MVLMCVEELIGEKRVFGDFYHDRKNQNSKWTGGERSGVIGKFLAVWEDECQMGRAVQ